ncbi:hypothetical protein EVAR_99337_1 [Eumeta japonica]|uniref:Uncharacterized protein n=1 Tax=Eumeta variegata TaxID=151549 RepID=A0A4C1ZDN0_EUMVA|nr:hypothetical protein EVAR_99337_1 [Eumeta japonica]
MIGFQEIMIEPEDYHKNSITEQHFPDVFGFVGFVLMFTDHHCLSGCGDRIARLRALFVREAPLRAGGGAPARHGRTSAKKNKVKLVSCKRIGYGAS